MFQPRIIHKGLALALIPLAFNVIWIALLSSSLLRAEALMAREHSQTTILTHINKATGLIFSSFGQLASFASNGSEGHRAKAEELNDDARKEIISLSQLAEGDSKLLNLLHELTATIDEDSQALETLKVQPEEANVLSRVKRLRNLVRQAGLKNTILMSIMNDKQAELELIRRSEEEAATYAHAVVIAGIISNFVLALVLILLIVKDVTSRLRILVENAHLLPKNIKLIRQVGGHDELSELDEEIHAASRQLIESADHRRGLMQMMAHDLRSPLAASMVSLEILQQNQKELNAAGEKQITLIGNNLKTSVELINDLLLLESLEVGHLALDCGPENLRELVDTATSTVSSLAMLKNIEIKNEVSKEYANIDRNRILQVVTNLLSNAIKFSPSRGLIRVVSAKHEGEIEITVMDSGRGLAPEEKANLFQKFHQTNEGKKAGGSGLGLAISKLIIESHGGTVGVNSEPGKGSEFWFSVPIERPSNY
jgi:signal transduction histidine kinase